MKKNLSNNTREKENNQLKENKYENNSEEENEEIKNKHNLIFNKNISELKKILENLKRKKADEIFQKGNYNLDLFEFVARKVFLSNVKNDKSNKKLNLLKDEKFDKTKNELTKFLEREKEENYTFVFLRNLNFEVSTIMSFIVMIISVLMIYLHFHLFFKDLNFRNI